jgi:hypothetical protein
MALSQQLQRGHGPNGLRWGLNSGWGKLTGPELQVKTGIINSHKTEPLADDDLIFKVLADLTTRLKVVLVTMLGTLILRGGGGYNNEHAGKVTGAQYSKQNTVRKNPLSNRRCLQDVYKMSCA